VGVKRKPVATGDLATTVRKGLDEAKDSIHAYVIQNWNIHRQLV
jgi:hypothetical protein